MNAPAGGGSFWDTGDDRSQVFAPRATATMLALKVRPPLLAQPAANEAPPLEALFLRAAVRAKG